MPPVLKKVGEYIGVLTVIWGTLWIFGKPLAQDFVKDTVEGRIGGIEQKITKEAGELTEQIEVLDKIMDEQKLSDTRQESDLSTVKSDLDEIKDAQKVLNEDIKSILRALE